MKIWLKKIIVLIVGIFFLLNFSFADTNTVSSNAFSLVQPIINLINLVWIPLVMVAGKLYTNWLVYGSNLHLDVILLNVWNFSKTIANFIIWFILVWAIFWLFIWKTKNIFSILWKITLATILINASWFLIWVLIDISTILLVAVGSFPMHMIWTTTMQAQSKLRYCKNIEIKYDWNILKDKQLWNIFSCEWWAYVSKTPEDFFKQMNNISWPLFFIWASILNIGKPTWVSKTETNKSWKDKSKKSVKVVAFSTMVYLVTLLLFIVPIILLIIIWIVRIFWIWLYVAFSPLIFLDQVFGWKVSGQHKAFKFSNMIWLVFIPVTVTFAMWIAVIFLSTLKTAFVSWNDDPAKKALWIKWHTIQIWGKTIVTIKWNLMNKTTEETWWFFGKLILLIMSSILLWSMLRLVFKSSEITSNISEWVYNFAEQTLKTVPILPIWKQWTSLWALQMWLNKWLTKSGFETRSSAQADKLLTTVKKTLWFKWWDILPTETTKRENKIISTHSNQRKLILPILWQFIQDMKASHKDLIPMYSPNFQAVVATAINQIWKKHKEIYEALKLLDKNDKPITSASEMFKQSTFKRFVVGIIQKTDKFEDLVKKGDTIPTIYSWITTWADASFLAKSLGDIWNSK